MDFEATCEGRVVRVEAAIGVGAVSIGHAVSLGRAGSEEVRTGTYWASWGGTGSQS